MSDQPPTPPRATPTGRAHIAPARGRTLDWLPILYLVGFVILAGALAYLWRHPTLPRGEAVQEARVDTLDQQVAANRAAADDLARRVGALEAKPAPAAPDLQPLAARIAALENRPVAAPVDLKPLSDRIAALENRPAPPTVDLKPLSNRIAALEARPPVDLKPLSDRVAALENKPPPPPVDLTPLEGRIAGLERKEATDAAAQAGAVAALGGQVAALLPRLDAGDKRVAALDSRLGAAEAAAKQAEAGLTTINERAQRLGRLQAVAVALAAGQPLGDLPGAPPALAKFAHQAPPTEPALRLSFDAAADAAQKASQPDTEGKGLLERSWLRAQQSLTVRQGDRVIVGDAVTGVLAHARQLLDAGDLQGAIHALDALNGPAKAAMADWIGRAQSLLDARAAVAAMASAQG